MFKTILKPQKLKQKFKKFNNYLSLHSADQGYICKSIFVSLYLASERSVRDTLRSVQLKIGDTRNVLLSAQMGERASVVLICIITSK